MFIRYNSGTQIWEVAANPDNPATLFNHLPIANPTQPSDTANKAYVDSMVSGGPFVPYTGAVANVNLGAFNLSATNVTATGRAFVGPIAGFQANLNVGTGPAWTTAGFNSGIALAINAFVRWQAGTSHWYGIGQIGGDTLHIGNSPAPDGSQPFNDIISFNIPGVTSILKGIALPPLLSPAPIVGNVNDYNPPGLATATVVSLNVTVAANMTGLQQYEVGRLIVLYNIGTGPLTLTFVDGLSAPGNRFLTPGGAPLVLNLYEGVILYSVGGGGAGWWPISRIKA